MPAFTIRHLCAACLFSLIGVLGVLALSEALGTVLETTSYGLAETLLILYAVAQELAREASGDRVVCGIGLCMTILILGMLTVAEALGDVTQAKSYGLHETLVIISLLTIELVRGFRAAPLDEKDKVI